MRELDVNGNWEILIRIKNRTPVPISKHLLDFKIIYLDVC